MTEDSSSSSFLQCIVTCLGIRRRHSHKSQSKRKKKEDMYSDTNVENAPIIVNGVESCPNRPDSQFNDNISTDDLKSEIGGKDDQSYLKPIAEPPPKMSPPVNIPVHDGGDRDILSIENPDWPASNHPVHENNFNIIPVSNALVSQDSSPTQHEESNTGQSVLTRNSSPPLLDERSCTAEQLVSSVLEKQMDELFAESLTVKSAVPMELDNTQQKTDKAKYPISSVTELENSSVEAITISDERRSCQGDSNHKYFRTMLEEEKNRLNDLVRKWSEILSQEDIDAEVQDEIRSVNGQTNLIISDRLCQFDSLITQSENPLDKQSDRKTIKSSDLQGFWDMIYFQIQDVSAKFQRLQKVRENGWSLDILLQQPPKKKPTIKNTSKKVLNQPNAEKEKARRIAARKRIAEARQRMKEQSAKAAQIDS